MGQRVLHWAFISSIELFWSNHLLAMRGDTLSNGREASFHLVAERPVLIFLVLLQGSLGEELGGEARNTA